MPPYTSLLVLALAASIVTPVLSANAATPLRKNEDRASASSHLQPVKRGMNNKLFIGFTGLVGTALLVDAIYSGVRMDKANTTAGSLGTRSSLDNTRWRTSSHPDLLNRADLGEALSLFGRMLDSLD